MSLNSTTLKVANNTSTWEKHILSRPKIHTIIYNSKNKANQPMNTEHWNKNQQIWTNLFSPKKDTRYINATPKQHSLHPFAQLVAPCIVSKISKLLWDLHSLEKTDSTLGRVIFVHVKLTSQENHPHEVQFMAIFNKMLIPRMEIIICINLYISTKHHPKHSYLHPWFFSYKKHLKNPFRQHSHRKFLPSFHAPLSTSKVLLLVLKAVDSEEPPKHSTFGQDSVGQLWGPPKVWSAWKRCGSGEAFGMMINLTIKKCCTEPFGGW